MGTIRVGTSGWQYDDWKGAFYPEDVAKKRWFEHYRTVFSTVEVNATFYRLPKETTVEKWHDAAPPGFRYAVKGSRYITHNLKLGEGTPEAIGNAERRMAALKSYLGVWLWQLPPNLHRDVDRLDDFLTALPSGYHAVEFRHRSWFDDDVYDVLKRHDAACVWISDKQMPDVFPLTADFVYVRLHGLSGDPDERYHYDYARDELEPLAERLVGQARDGRDGWVFFNNDYQANAPRNALTLIELLGDAAEPWGDATSR
ncbi:MAG: DUF72 domain-containing protein [Actinobacteria bacterium]|nr:DUF72 domain-containing protein [Actinomycetota bacterium]